MSLVFPADLWHNFRERPACDAPAPERAARKARPDDGVHLVFPPAGCHLAARTGATAVRKRTSGIVVLLALIGAAGAARAAQQQAPATDARAADAQEYLYLREAPIASLPLKAKPRADSPSAGGEERAPRFTFTPRVGVADPLGRSLTLSGRLAPLSSFTPRYRESEITISILPPEGRPDKAVGIALSSEYLIQDGSVFGFTGAGSPLDSRAYQLGIAFRMSGFSLGATVQRQEGGLLGERAQGVDLGLGYRIGAFETQLAIGEFSSSSRGLDALVDRSFYRLDLGAAYRISERVRLSGGIRLFDYVNAGAAPELANRAGMLYLGTSLSF